MGFEAKCLAEKTLFLRYRANHPTPTSDSSNDHGGAAVRRTCARLITVINELAHLGPCGLQQPPSVLPARLFCSCGGTH